LRSHSSRWARRSSGLIFPAILFLSEQPFELGVDVHQHANDAIDRFPVEDRLIATPHPTMVSLMWNEGKVAESD
jgi:hypothetical protein